MKLCITYAGDVGVMQVYPVFAFHLKRHTFYRAVEDSSCHIRGDEWNEFVCAEAMRFGFRPPTRLDRQTNEMSCLRCANKLVELEIMNFSSSNYTGP